MTATFRFSALGQLQHGPGCVEEKLASICEALNYDRVFLLTTPSLANNGQLDTVSSILGNRLVGTFAESIAHTPRSVVIAAAEAVESTGANALVCLGGSSVVDLAKGTAIVVAEGTNFDAHRVVFDPTAGLKRPRLRAPKIPIIAIPTTLSGSEFTSGAGLTDPDRGEKDLYVDSKITPQVVFHDATLARKTPEGLWSQSGMKIVADCIEFATAARSQPMVRVLSLAALRILMDNLESAQQGNNIEARQNCLNAVFMVMSVSGNAGAGLVAGLRHQLGALLGLPHGAASTIVLPHVMRWNMVSSAQAYASIANELSIDGPEPGTAESLIAHVESLARSLRIPARLGDFGVRDSDLPPVADRTLGDFVIANNPRAVTHGEQVLEVLRLAL